MEETLLKMDEAALVPTQASVTLSFNPFLEYLKKRLQNERTVKTEYYRHIIERFTENPSWKTGLPAHDLTAYKELFEIVYFVLTPLAADDRENMWGLSTPVPTTLFYSTESLSKFFADNNTIKEPSATSSENCHVSKDMQFMYGLVLERFYNISSLAKNDTVYSYTNTVTKLSRFYKVHVDTQFVDIRVNGALPELDYDVLATYLHDGTGSETLICKLKKMLPLHNFIFEGFTVITLTDVTAQHALDKIREVMVHHSYNTDQYLQISRALKTIAGNEHIEFRLVPIIGVNGKSTFASNEECIQSVLINALQESGITEDVLNTFIEKYQRNPRILVYNGISSEEKAEDHFLRILKKTPVESYALLPVYYHRELTGVLEIYSEKEILFDERLFSKMQTAIPLIAQLLKFTRDEFQAQLSNVIRDKFTSLQPAVQWRFNEVAWHYLQRNYTDLNNPDIEEIRFENVYPLYGAIDVRNSTSERNRAIHEDIKSQLTLLQDTLLALKSIDKRHEVSDGTIDEECTQWKDQIDGYFTSRDEIALNNFLETEVHPYLLEVQDAYPEARAIVSRYLGAIDEREGDAFKNRSELETSLQLINSKLNQYFDVAQKMLQAEYPFYFEKFRTDGIEYDLYIGQSIAPEKQFEVAHLRRLRQWQLQSMAEIARLTQRLLPYMSRHLHTTQLIFVHARAIDITFRNDERRFDVEGAYNIRYEVIKKRIDKVLIKDTRERLTQPGKIAIVYFNQQEAQEYVGYIRELQQKGLLDDSLEYLELEELQGVNRLKALRIGVKYH
jgi:hypothetical protein